ncbi:MAG: hypothetical protein L0027_08055, partial [Candidatus Rokubacteria bacterium]|nr:hypothetical protein [Candidatus Rokubacteria bacterium]
MAEPWEESAGRSGVVIRVVYLAVGLLVGVALGYGLWGYRVRQIASEMSEIKAYVLEQQRLWTQELSASEGKLAEVEAQLQRLRELSRSAPPPAAPSPAPPESRPPPSEPPPPPELPPRPRST